MSRVLVIDDQKFVRDTISLILKAKGFEVIEADSGTLGLKKLETSDFNLAIVDIYLPGIDGVKIIKLAWEYSSIHRTVRHSTSFRCSRHSPPFLV